MSASGEISFELQVSSFTFKPGSRGTVTPIDAVVAAATAVTGSLCFFAGRSHYYSVNGCDHPLRFKFQTLTRRWSRESRHGYIINDRLV